MMIKIRKTNYLAILFLILCIPLILDTQPLRIHTISNLPSDSQTPSTALCENLLLDKVFTFTIGNTTLNKTFELTENYYYYVTTEVVTPHNCDIEVFVVSPKNRTTSIIYGSLIYDSENSFKLRGKHGTADNGTHTFIFSVKSEKKLNIHLRIWRGEFVLPPPPPDPDDFPTDINEFYDEETLNFNATLEADWSYRFLFKRVSANARNETAECKLALNLSDNSDIPFEIYANETILEPFEEVSFNFGTAWTGIYSVHIYVYYESRTVNIGFGIEKDYQITCETPVNNQSSQYNQTQNFQNGKFIFPNELSVVVICIVVPCVVGAAVVIGYISIIKPNKKK